MPRTPSDFVFSVPLRAWAEIDGRLIYLWCAVDAEGEVLDILVQSKWDKRRHRN